MLQNKTRKICWLSADIIVGRPP